MVVGVTHDIQGNERRPFDPLDRSNRTGATRRPMHERGIQLNHTVLVREAAVSNRGIARVLFYQVHAPNHSFDRGGTVREFFDGPSDRIKPVR
jgi:hypothetical protein